MNRDEFYDLLSKTDLEVVFEKKTDGTIRTIRCSANAPKSDGPKQNRATKPDTLITVYDIEARGWRSFYSDCIKEVRHLDTNFGLLQE